jgi:insulysin
MLVSDPEADKAAAAMDVNVGSWGDPAQFEGLAHFCEHMLFMGTR